MKLVLFFLFQYSWKIVFSILFMIFQYCREPDFSVLQLLTVSKTCILFLNKLKTYLARVSILLFILNKNVEMLSIFWSTLLEPFIEFMLASIVSIFCRISKLALSMDILLLGCCTRFSCSLRKWNLQPA